MLSHVAAILTVTGLCLATWRWPGCSSCSGRWPGGRRPAGDGQVHRSDDAGPAGLPLALGHFLFAFGIIVFGVAIWRSGFGYRWAGPAIAIGVVIDIVGGTAGLPETVVGVLSDAVFVTGLVAVGLKVLLTSDADWAAGTDMVRSAQPRSAAVASQQGA